jgi:hypothetical protein
LSRFLRKIGSWLGLFAILMATLAPTISHTLAARTDDDAMSDGPCPMSSMDDMPAMQDVAMLAPHAPDRPDTPDTATAPDDSASKHSQMSDGDACGYCSLLAHFPAMPSVGALFLVGIRAREHIVATRFASVRRVEPLTFAQPRAPPVAS